MKKRIFVIDDEKDIQEILKINLVNEGYEVITFSSGEAAWKGLTKNAVPDLVILDVMMEGMDGYEFCKKLHSSDEFRTVPVIFLSAKTEEFDKVLGLELGGDDYIAKPFAIRELKSRVKAVLRRMESSSGLPGQRILKFEGIELFSDDYSLKIDGTDVELTKTEFAILNLFLANPGKIFSRDNIIDSIRGYDTYVVDRTIDVHVMNLRKKLGPYKNSIRTFSGVGYGFKNK